MAERLRGHCAVIINSNGDVVAEATDVDGGTHTAGLSREASR